MKRFVNYVMVVIVAAITVSSCINELEDSFESHTITSITAAAEQSDPETKTILDGVTLKSSWIAGDAINVFFGASESSKFTCQSDGAIAQFKGSIDVVTGGGDGLTDDTSLWGIYPYSSKTTCDGTSVTYTLPSVQEAKAGSFADDLFPTVAKSKNFYMSFNNLCGSFRFTVTNPDIVKVTLRGNENENIAGRAKVIVNEYPEVSEIIEGTTLLTMNAPDGQCFEVGKDYYFALYPTEFKSGLTLTFYKSDSMAEYVHDSAYTLRRNVFTRFRDKDKNLTFSPINDKPSDQNIIFADAVMKEMCVNAFDTNGDGELSYAEAAAVTDLSQMNLTKKTFKTFDEFQYFTSVKSIPDSYFKQIGIQSITLPEGLVSIGDSSFESSSLTALIKLPESLTSIGNASFKGCTRLTTIEFPESLTSIGDHSFMRCSSIVNLNLPDGILSIGNSAFHSCTGLIDISIPKEVKYIGNSVFSGCTNLETANLPEGITQIPDTLFYHCSRLSKVNIPEGVTKIGNRAFYETNLREIVIPESLSECGSEIFAWSRDVVEGNTSLEKVFISNLSAWCKIDFDNQSGNPLCDADLYLNGELLVDLLIPEDISFINHYSFYRCNSIKNVIIPEGVIGIGKQAFSRVDLDSITIPESMTQVDGFMSHCDKIYLNNLAAWFKIEHSSDWEFRSEVYINGQKVEHLILPDDITTIPESIKPLLGGPIRLTIPESVTSIGNYAFENCTGLTSVTIPESVISIGNNAFESCTGLTSVTIPESVISIGNNAFESCTGLTSVTIPKSITNVGDYAFNNCTGLTSLILSEGIESIGNSAFYNCTDLTSVTIPKSVTNVGDLAFYNCTNLTSLILSEGIESIGYRAFDMCSKLTSIRINSITPPEISSYAFGYNIKPIFYVPAEAVETYKSADGWSRYASSIVGY